MTKCPAPEMHNSIRGGMIPGLVSIILPVHDRAGEVTKALESVLHQTEKNWELICVDDGSRDGSGELLDRYAGKDARIHVIHTEPRGVSHARNCGLAAARGEWIAFLDDDDRIAPSFLEVMLRYTTDPGTDVICCSIREENLSRPKEPEGSARSGDGDLNSPADAEDVQMFENLTQVLQAVLDSDKENGRLIYTVWGKLYRHEALQKPFDESLLREEDFCYNLDNWGFFRRLVRLKERLYHYHIHQEKSLNHAFYIGQPQMLRSWMERVAQADVPRAILDGMAGIYKYRICRHYMSLCLAFSEPPPDPSKSRKNLLLVIRATLTDDLFDVISSVPDAPVTGFLTEEIPFDRLWDLLKDRNAERIADVFRTQGRCFAARIQAKEMLHAQPPHRRTEYSDQQSV